MAHPTQSGKIKEENKKAKGTSKGSYEVQPVDMDSHWDREAALRELSLLQSSTIANYKTWAKEKVKYTDLDSKTSVQNLKECNDAYTMSMLTNCITPFNEGVTVGALMSSWFTYKTAEMLNPSFNQDVSRMMLNMRDDMIPMLTQNAKHGKFPMNTMSKAFLHHIDGQVVKASTDLMHDEIVKGLENNSLDDMTMTPRQVAALKVNFMEQYYVDLRQYNPDKPSDVEKMRVLEKQYDTAIQHLDVIAHNGGFDMSVVAAEERALVGMKIKENPSYANMFKETDSFYGVRQYNRDDNGLWSGDFESVDGHPHYTAGNQGAFTVRQPVKQETVMKNLQIEGDLLGQMALLAKNKSIPMSDKTRRELNEQLKRERKAYCDRTIHLLQDDYGMSEKAAKEFIHSNLDSRISEVIQKNGSQEASAEGIAVLQTEFTHVIEKECMDELGLSEYYARPDDTAGRKEMIQHVIYEANKRGYEIPKGMTAKEAFDNYMDILRDNYVKSMSSDELSRAFMHAGNNLKQRYDKTGKFYRYTTEKHVDMDAVKRRGYDDLDLTKDDEEHPSSNIGDEYEP